VATSVAAEAGRRKALWGAIRAAGGPDAISPDLIRNLNVYSGARGIYADAETTSGLADAGGAVTVSLLHTGKVYPDELSADGVVYHYPDTLRPGKDAQEIEATKAASRLGLPVFVIVTSSNPSLRDVRLGWVTGWNDSTQEFYVAFADERPSPIPAVDAVDETPFRLTALAPGASAVVQTRPGQARFKFEVFGRYGASCAVCDLAIEGLLDAAHIRDKRFSGSDDARNGLVLCALHHRAMDRGLFGIDPVDKSLHALATGPTLAELGITRIDLSHLRHPPHETALEWRWRQWRRLAQAEDAHGVELRE
jgi:putative restriction endonuclease